MSVMLLKLHGSITTVSLTIYKYLETLRTLNRLVKLRATGSPAELGKTLGMSEKNARRYIEQMKLEGCPIAYCRKNNSYYYTEQGEYVVGWKKTKMFIEIDEMG